MRHIYEYSQARTIKEKIKNRTKWIYKMEYIISYAILDEFEFFQSYGGNYGSERRPDNVWGLSELRKTVQDRINRRRGRMALLCRSLHKPCRIPAGARLQPDQATLRFVDGNMNEYMREEYIKVHGIDPLPIWKAMEKWREEQMKKWKI